MIVRQKLLRKVYDRFCQIKRHDYIVQVEKDVQGYGAFVEDLTDGKAVGVRGYPWRAMDQLKILRKVAPQRIVELGSGTSTGLFARYVHQTHGASLLSLDESEDWARLSLKGLERAGLAPHPAIRLEVARRMENAAGSFYAFDLPLDIDLLYIDGPSVMKVEGKKTANQDIVRLFERGGRPRAIMVDGRVATVQAIADHEAGRHYHFIPGMPYIFASGDVTWNFIMNFGRFHRHSIFLLK